MKPVTRRDFVRTAAFATAAAKLMSTARAQNAGAATAAMPRASTVGAAPVRWLDGAAPRAFGGATWGLSWPQGQHTDATAFTLKAASGETVPVQTWPLATWPDGSLKWTAHAAPADLTIADH